MVRTAGRPALPVAVVAKLKNYYEILGVSCTATTQEIRQAYRRLARQYHPDLQRDQPLAEERFKEISAAYYAINKARRKNGSGKNGSVRVGATVTVEAELEVTLEELHSGSSKDITIQRETVCVACQPERRPKARACRHCQGQGIITQPQTYRVKIPKGLRDGAIIRFSLNGSRRGADPAAVRHLRLRVLPHPFLTVLGDDLSLEVLVTPEEVAQGATIQVPTLTGELPVALPTGLKDGDWLCLPGQGLSQRPRGRGDLYLQLRIKGQ